MSTYCQLVVPKNGRYTKKWRSGILNKCLTDPRIYRVTNHFFYKVKAFEEIDFKNSRWIVVKDKTKHFDETIWHFANQFWTYASSKRNKKKYIGILIHYLLNLEGVWPEAEWFRRMWIARKKLEKSKNVDKDVDHGWEIKELKKAGLYK